jgi:hypothetical protein
MTEIQQLNKLERMLNSFGVQCNPRQTAKGEILLPIHYKGEGFTAVLSSVGGNPTEEWWGKCSTTIRKRVKEHFQAFIAVDSL